MEYIPLLGGMVGVVTGCGNDIKVGGAGLIYIPYSKEQTMREAGGIWTFWEPPCLVWDGVGGAVGLGAAVKRVKGTGPSARERFARGPARLLHVIA